jgi:hypothetical protein
MKCVRNEVADIFGGPRVLALVSRVDFVGDDLDVLRGEDRRPANRCREACISGKFLECERIVPLATPKRVPINE